MAIIKEDGIVRGKKDKSPPPPPQLLKKKNEIENKNKK
jgi:hypothetical protein